MPSLSANVGFLSSPMAETAQRRKRPPSFQHFPINRAIKLKQAWVQNTKLKSKWKAEKRKEGIAAPHREKGDEDEVEDAEGFEAEAKEPESKTAPTPPTRPPPSKKGGRRKQPDPPEAESSAMPTLRDRAREAYSRASLHTYRSDPFGKRQRGGKDGTTTGRGQRGIRGQPDMKKRMDVLLETIKRDFT
ncbi:hypothetical protein B0H16DRAFT_1838932, partial [Mycena metata]